MSDKKKEEEDEEVVCGEGANQDAEESDIE